MEIRCFRGCDELYREVIWGGGSKVSSSRSIAIRKRQAPSTSENAVPKIFTAYTSRRFQPYAATAQATMPIDHVSAMSAPVENPSSDSTTASCPFSVIDA